MAEGDDNVSIVQPASRKPRRRGRRLLAGVAIIGLVSAIGGFGCVHQLIAHAVVTAPNTGVAINPADDPQGGTFDRLGRVEHRRIEVDGEAPASLSVYLMRLNDDQVARGTVFVLHGIRDRKDTMIWFGRSFRDAGFDVVAVDLRGHGRSTGDQLSYGVHDRYDLTAIADVLLADGEITPPIGVFGPSYGGAVALLWAGVDPRVKAVVTVATYTSLRDVVPEYVDRFGFGLGGLVPEASVERGVNLAGELGRFDPDLASPIEAVSRVTAPCLFVHGTADVHISADHSKRLHEAAAGEAELLLLDGATHLSVFAEPHWQTVRERSIDWFIEQLDPLHVEPAKGKAANAADAAIRE